MLRQYNPDGVPVPLWVACACMSYRHWLAKLNNLIISIYSSRFKVKTTAFRRSDLSMPLVEGAYEGKLFRLSL